MEPPPTVRYNPFNELNRPRGFFEWSILNEAFEVVKAYPVVFMGFSLIAYFGTAILGQIASIPQLFAQFSNGPIESKIPLYALAYILSTVLQTLGLGVTMGGYSSMLRRYGESKYVDIGDGFKPISKALHLGLAQFAPMLATLPFYAVAAVFAFPHLIAIATPNFSDSNAAGEHILGIIIPMLLVSPVYLAIYPFFYGAVPAVVLEDLTAWEAVKRSIEMAKRCYWQLFLLQFIFGLAILVSVFLCCIPALFAFAWYGVSLGLIYSNVMGIPLAPQGVQGGYSNYPREMGGEMPPVPENPRPPDFPTS